MKALIVDDEAPARFELRRLLNVHSDVEVVGDVAGVDEALAGTAQHHPDVVFLDIQLAGESGFDYVGRLSESDPYIVFVTAYDRYAVRGFECNALDYLLKPVHPDRLTEALRRVRSRDVKRRRAEEDDMVFIKAGAVARFVSWRDMQYLTSAGNYSHVHLSDGTELIVLRPLKNWLALAPEGLFLQIHRSTLVRIGAICELRQAGQKKHEITLSGGAVLRVGREFMAPLREYIGNG